MVHDSSHAQRRARRSTHRVENQTPPLEGFQPVQTDRALLDALEREGAGWARDQVRMHSQQAGSAEVVGWGFLANEHVPRLRSHDRSGNRIDELTFHPAWHELMRWSIANQVHSLPWNQPEPGVWAARAAMLMLSASVDAGHCCPISMATACVPTLRMQPDVGSLWEAKVRAVGYDPRFVPVSEKPSCLIGMAMTEKQGGSDVRANSTSARPLGRAGGGQAYALTGHKWFCSAPMCDAFLVLAQTPPKGLSCFLLPRFEPDGNRNGLYIQRLKDKLGNRSNASSEVEFDDAFAWLIGEEGRGVPAIIEMVMVTRLDCALISAGMMRLGLVHAVHHARHRAAFGKKLIDQPLMQNVLADLALESEAATLLLMRLARSFDRRASSEEEQLFHRLVTAIAKYWVCKRAPVMIGEAMECIGGNGYIEETVFPRMYREAPLNSIWEGSGNVICLDVLRALRNEPRTMDVLVQELELAGKQDAAFNRELDRLQSSLQDATRDPAASRLWTERAAKLLQASLLLRHSPPFVADAFCRSRLGAESGSCYGTLPRGVDYRAIVDRAVVAGLNVH